MHDSASRSAATDERRTKLDGNTPLEIGEHLVQIDHIAVAVRDLDLAEQWFSEVLGFRCIERRDLEGTKSGMRSVVMQAGPIVFVLVQGTTPESQVSRFVREFGQGVQHIALGVRGIDRLVRKLKGSNLPFSTRVVTSGELRQVFARRNPDTGLMLEFIERGNFSGFADGNVDDLFRQLEESDEF